MGLSGLGELDFAHDSVGILGYPEKSPKMAWLGGQKEVFLGYFRGYPEMA